MFKPNKNMMKKAQSGLDGKMTALIGGVIIVFLAAELAPEMFAQLSLLDSGDTPAWVSSILVIVVGAGLVFLIWRVLTK